MKLSWRLIGSGGMSSYTLEDPVRDLWRLRVLAFGIGGDEDRIIRGGLLGIIGE